MEKLTTHELILKTLKEKSSLKQDVYFNTTKIFDEFRSVLKELAEEFRTEAKQIDRRIIVDYSDKGEFDVEFKIASDVLIFHQHSNIFEFDQSHPIWKTSYVRNNDWKSYCGMINVYNFLNDSFKYNRVNDIGYLIARIFVNKEFHFFVEGKRQMAFLYNDFVNGVIDRESIKSICQSAILYCLDFDLFTPPYDNVKEVTVYDIQELSNNPQLQTGKRLGFKFQADDDFIR